MEEGKGRGYLSYKICSKIFDHFIYHWLESNSFHAKQSLADEQGLSWKWRPASAQLTLPELRVTRDRCYEFKYFRRKNCRFLLKTKLNYAKIGSFLRKTPIFSPIISKNSRELRS
jgi:hypothetical protein